MNPLQSASRQWMKVSWNGLTAFTPMERTRKVVRPRRTSPDAPFVFPWHYPNGARTHVNVRIDADWCAREEWERTMNILEPLGPHASWFITTGKVADQDVDVFDRLKAIGVEIGSHMHFHFTFEDEANNRNNMRLAHQWLAEHGVQCRSFVSPSAKWSPALQRCIDDMGYVYSSEFGLAHDCLPFSMDRGTLQIPVHAVCPGNFTERNGIDGYYHAVADALYRACLPIHLYAHPHDSHHMGKGVIEKIASLPDVNISTLMEYARWWKDRRCTYDLRYDRSTDTWTIDWSGSDGVWLAVSWDGVTHSLLNTHSEPIRFRRGELPPGKQMRMQPYDFPAPVPIKKRLNWRSRIGMWLDLEYVVPPAYYQVSSPKTLVNYLLKLRPR